MDVKDTLTDKVGPLPVWGWGLILGGVAVAFMWFNNRGDTSAQDGYAPATATGIDPYGDSGLYTGGNAGDQYSNDTSGDTGDSTDAAGPARIRNNTQWLAAGVAYLAGKGHTALASQRALSRYLGSKPLNVSQRALVDSAIAGVGMPPNPPALAKPKPVKDKPKPKPGKPHKHKGNDKPKPHKPKPGTKPKPRVIRAADPVVARPHQSTVLQRGSVTRTPIVSRTPSRGGLS